MLLPPRPKSGERLDAAWGARVIDYLRSITPSSGPNYRVKRTANGTSFDIAPAGSPGAASAPGPLVIVQTAPGKVRVTWGAVNNVVPSNIATEADFSAVTGTREVWLEITMQTVAPYKVISVEVKAEESGIPEPESPDPATGAPADKLYYLLGQVEVDNGTITNIENTNGRAGGSIGVTVQSIGSVCREAQPADPGDPEAEPPIPPTPAIEGGVVDMLAWVAWRDNGNG